MIDSDLLSSMQGKLQNPIRPSHSRDPVTTAMYLGFPAELQAAFIRREGTFSEHPWRDRFSSSVAIFPRSSRIVINRHGVFIPWDVLGTDVVVESERQVLRGGGVRVVVSAQPRDRRVEPPRRVEVIDCSRELQWLREHRNEYAGQWVALDGDRLIASGPDARPVYEAARASGVDLPLVTEVEAADERPFGGW